MTALLALLTACGRPDVAGGVTKALPLGSQPVQTDIAELALGERMGFRLTGVAGYRLSARVAHSERYRFDAQAKLAPVDLALAWGPAVEPSVLTRLGISQSNRWFHWHTKSSDWPLPRAVLEANMANVHIIPASTEVFDLVASLTPGDAVALEGYLVDVTTMDGRSGTRSSRSRTDTGPGACEIFYVTAARRLVGT